MGQISYQNRTKRRTKFLNKVIYENSKHKDCL